MLFNRCQHNSIRSGRRTQRTTSNSGTRNMGGGHRFPYPKWVWTPSGGWWPNPKNSTRNGLIYTAACGVICYYAVLYCQPKTVAYYPKLVHESTSHKEDGKHGKH